MCNFYINPANFFTRATEEIVFILAVHVPKIVRAENGMTLQDLWYL